MTHEDAFGNDPRVLSDEDFVAYLADTLIPDLVASGMDSTAEDFLRCVYMIERRDKLLDEIKRILKGAQTSL